MTTITIERTILDRLIEAWDSTVLPTHRDGMMQERMEDLRAELAKPVERVEPITLDQFRAIANRTATTYRHRSDPEKSSYAFVDGSSLDDFWRKVCEAIQPTSAWNDAPEVAALKAERDELLAALQGVAQMSQCGQLDQFIGEPWLNSVFAAIAKAEEKNHERP